MNRERALGRGRGSRCSFVCLPIFRSDLSPEVDERFRVERELLFILGLAVLFGHALSSMASITAMVSTVS